MSAEKPPLDDTLPASGVPTDAVPHALRPSLRESGRGGSAPTLDRYRLGVELGRGGMGRVVEALDTQLGRTVALKEVLPSVGDANVRRFLREVQITARLEHPSIVPLYDAGTGPDGRPFYVMRRVTGRPLDELLARARSLDERVTLLPAVLAAIDAVAHAHRRGVLHRDLKPGNILVGDLGETVVIDWGLAKVVGEPDDDSDPAAARELSAADSLQTQFGSVFGTPGFMAPEQARGEALGTYGDVYALGATLYQLLAGAPPHHAKSATEMMSKTMRHEVTPVRVLAPGAPVELVAVVDKALAFDAEQRYPDAGALAEDVRRFLAGQLVAAHHYTPRQRLRRFAHRYRGMLVVGVIALSTLGGLGGLGVRRIVAEKDTARRAEAAATKATLDVERARDELAERQDALLLATARGSLETNPTETAAVLKRVPIDSPLLATARGLAQAAVARGVAWSIPTEVDRLRAAKIAPDGSSCFALGQGGRLEIFDLERRHRTGVHAVDRTTSVHWIGSQHLLLLGTTSHVLTLATNAVTPLPSSRPTTWSAATQGSRLLVTDATGAHRLDVSTGESERLPADGPVLAAVLSSDGRWYALVTTSGLTVYDEQHQVRVRRAGTFGQLAASAQRLAVREGEGLIEYRFDDVTPGWNEIVLPGRTPARAIYTIGYAADALHVRTSDLTTWRAEGAAMRGYPDPVAGTYTASVPGERPVLISPDRTLHWLAATGYRSVKLPKALAGVRAFIDPGGRRLVAIGSGRLFGFEVAEISPQVLPVPGADMAFAVDARTLLVTTALRDWFWLDRTTLTVVGQVDAEVSKSAGVTGYGGGMVVVDRFSSLPTSSSGLLTSRARQLLDLGPPKETWGYLVPEAHGAIFGPDGGRQVSFRPAAAAQPARLLAEFDSAVVSWANLHDGRVAIHQASGALTVIDIVTGARAPLATGLPAAMRFSSDGQGGLVGYQDDRIYRIGTAATALVTMPGPITNVFPTATGGLAVTIAGYETHEVDVATGRRRGTLLTSPMPPWVTADTSMFVALASLTRLTVAEPGTAAAWSFPVEAMRHEQAFSVSSFERAILVYAGAVVLLYRLPRAGSNLPEWLEDRTDAEFDFQATSLRFSRPTP